jgi:hypothetical protein
MYFPSGRFRLAICKKHLKGEHMKAGVQKRLKDTLTKNHACYVLITCQEPSEDGNMQVEMSYEGDVALASYLLLEAQNFIEELDSQPLNDENPKKLQIMK